MSKENRSSHAAKRGPMGHRGPGAPTEKAKNFKGTMKQLIAYMRPYYLNIIVSMLFCRTVCSLYGRWTKDSGKGDN